MNYISLKAKIWRLNYKFIKVLLRLSKRKFDITIMDLFKDLFKEEYIQSNSEKGKKITDFNFYTSYTPDRYSINYQLYKQQTNFLDYENLGKWLSGNYDNNIGDISRFFFLNLCIDYLLEEGLAGNVAEVGVYKGNSAFLLAKYVQDERVNCTCYLFDTYEGFDKRDMQNHDALVNNNLFTDTSIEYVKQLIGNNKNVVYVKGYFPQSLTDVGELNSFSLVHIDCDLEKPITDSLNYFYPKLIKGGFLILHDYSSLFWTGAKHAIESFFKDKNEFVIPVPDKSGSCVIRKT